MSVDPLSLSRQLDMVFRELHPELAQLCSGTICIQIRNNMIGKFGIRHLPMEGKDGKWEEQTRTGLTDLQQRSLLKMTVESLKYKAGWTHGEMFIDFTLRHDKLCTSVQFESNYNMSNLLLRKA